MKLIIKQVSALNAYNIVLDDKKLHLLFFFEIETSHKCIYKLFIFFIRRVHAPFVNVLSPSVVLTVMF